MKLQKVRITGKSYDEFATNLFKWFVERFKYAITSSGGCTIVTDTDQEFKFRKHKSDFSVKWTTAGIHVYPYGGTVHSLYHSYSNYAQGMNIHYYENEGIFIIAHITGGEDENFDINLQGRNQVSPMPFYIDEKMAFVKSKMYGNFFELPGYLKTADDWRVATKKYLVNQVMVWPVQCSVYTVDRMYRFQTEATNFPTKQFDKFGVQGVGEFMIIEPCGGSGSTNAGLAFKIG